MSTRTPGTVSASPTASSYPSVRVEVTVESKPSILGRSQWHHRDRPMCFPIFRSPIHFGDEVMITCVVGTNRPNSHSRRIATELQQTYARLERPFELLELADLPPELILPSAYAQKPAGLARFSERVL